MTVTEPSPKLFCYTCKFFNDEDGAVITEKGITAGFSYDSAVKRLEACYSEKCIVSIEVYESFLVLDEEEIYRMFES